MNRHMKNMIVMNNRFFLVTVFLVFMISSQSYAENIVRITNGEWRPFYSKSLKFYGPDSQIVTESFAMEGIKVVYGFFPWQRSYLLSKNGTWDGAIGWPYSKKRAKYHYYSELPINEGEWVFFHRKGFIFDWNNIDDLKKAKFGITIGEWILDGEDEVTKALRQGDLEIEYVRKDELNFLKLSMGRIDIFPQQLDVGYEQLNNLVTEKKLTKEAAFNITHHHKPFRRMALYLLLSKKIKQNKDLIKLFNKGFKRLKKSGKYEEIINEISRKR